MPEGPPKRASWVLIGFGASLLALGSGLLAAGFLPAAGERPAHVTVVHSDAADPIAPEAPAPAPTSDAWWKPLPLAHGAFVPALLVIEKLKVQAPIEVKGVDAHNVMEAPDRPADVAWYRFTARPGSGSNAVFSAHRDFASVGPAVFWHLDQLGRGDMVDVVSGEQTEIRYQVTQVWQYGVNDMPMEQVLATDRRDEVTLITCSGRYTPSTGYDHRLVVRAERAP